MKTPRRTQLKSLAALLVSGIGIGRSGAEGSKAPIVLVHGAWHGAWCWQRVAPLLRAAGHAVFTPTLPGQGERAAELPAVPSLGTHIEELDRYLKEQRLDNVVLVGHSYGGIVISGVADRSPERLRTLIYLDALILSPGESIASRAGASWAERVRGLQPAYGIPSPPPEAFGVLKPEDQAWVAPLLTRQPLHTFDQPLVLHHKLGNGVPKVYIECNSPEMPSVSPYKERVRASKSDWIAYESLPTGHDAMVTMPGPLSGLLLKYAG